ncbi:MAG: hypothetical protein SGJ27_26585 [Candidatus Melainabacteria bacterium]|nr:hypothetical protein [Candidatus Melainabacteria bacterium]
MNTQLARAITAVQNANTVAQRLAAQPTDEATRTGSNAGDNRDFTSAVTAAREQVLAAMDECESRTLTDLDYAQNDLEQALNAYAVTIVSNRLNAADFTSAALRRMPSARSASED